VAASKPETLFVKGFLLLNTILIPIAAVGIYITYKGKKLGDSMLLTVGVTVTVAAPLMAAVLAYALANRLWRQQT
jgi:hypothetical protein